MCTSKEIMSIADAMAENGMKDLGYEYINLDGEHSQVHTHTHMHTHTKTQHGQL